MGKMNKKGIFFTFIAITIMAIFILVYTPQADITLQKDNKAVELRINTLDNYVSDLEQGYFETALRATTHKTILSLIAYMDNQGVFLTDFDSAFSEVMIKGTINGVPIDTITGEKIMENSTLTNWSNSLIETAEDTFNVNTTISLNNVSVRQTRPWHLDSSLGMDFAIKSKVADWDRKNVTITTTVSIEGFEDPYYLVNTNGAYKNEILKTGVKFNKWNITALREHLRNSTYVHWQNSDAPDFLMRFTNTIEKSSCCGIESLVNPNKLSASDQTESYIDYLFWTNTYNTQCSLLYNISKPPPSGALWDEFRFFKLDINNTIRYNITDDDAVRTC
jgi:hypothetical protein|tara:strand:+ start:6172 stop:7173 length:1002 start_codon:yes stop_codon:yes gene_type:complete